MSARMAGGGDMDLKRRGFLAAGASAIAVASLPGAAATEPAGEHYPVGDFILTHTNGGLRVAHRRKPDRIIWESGPDGNFIIAEQASATIKEFGAPEGTFEITDAVSESYEKPTIEAIKSANGAATVSGTLGGPAGAALRYTLAFEAVSSTHLRFVIRADGPEAAGVNRIRLVIGSAADEAIFGCGEQLTDFNQKGNILPILVQEHGIGRGRPVITELVNLFDHRSGGDPYHTGAPAPHFITSRLRSLFLENLEYSVFDMRPADHIDIKVWAATMTGRILYGETPLDLIETYTEYAGRMRVLPDWAHNGAILGLMGGTEVVRAKLGRARAADVPVAGLWLQDWVGVRTTFAGTQLWWNWTLDEAYYPRWPELVADVESQGGRVLLYINPYLATEEGHNQLFTEARKKGYLVRKADGAPYLIRNSSFYVGMLDLSHPQAREWIKGIIKTNMIGAAGAAGWMNDFGEALPFDAKLYDGADPALWHNRYADEWSRINREAIEESGRGDDMVFFARAGFTRTPGVATLFWLGDQLMSWDAYDGIKTAVVGLLSAGVSGFSLMHSDVGGYVVIKINVAGRQIPIINRTPELLMRWMELNAFTAVFRTMEGAAPDLSPQFDASPATLAQMARFAKVYKGLGLYRKKLVAEAAARGWPVVRPLFLHYPGDPNTYGLRYQFLLGRDLMVAPVLDKGADAVDVYFPEGSRWTSLWSGADAGKAGAWVRMPAPIGEPAVFLRKGGPGADEIIQGLKSVGVLN
jgi:sulfoquinovosidase